MQREGFGWCGGRGLCLFGFAGLCCLLFFFFCSSVFSLLLFLFSSSSLLFMLLSSSSGEGEKSRGLMIGGDGSRNEYDTD